MRIRGKIFDLLAREILCRPIFGLDDYDSKGVMEAELSRFESAIKPHVGGKNRSDRSMKRANKPDSSRRGHC